jgi:hypothetical protein
MKNVAPRTDLRIVHQARTPHGRRYHFVCDDRRLALEFSSAGGDGAEWTVAATGRERLFASDVSLSAQAPTRIDALRGAARIWREDSMKYPTFEWDAIESLLREVKAL